MVTTLTSGAVTITPDAVTGYAATRTAQTVVHRIIGRSDPDVTFAPASLRAGRLTLVFADRAAAHAADAALAVPGVWTLTNADAPDAGMVFVVVDQIALTYTDAGTLVEAGFEEVAE